VIVKSEIYTSGKREIFDYIVTGGASVGCTIAARLSKQVTSGAATRGRPV